MFFILLLMLVTTSIAGSAAYFSVHGLASTFPGVFWSVVVMGGSLEAGKLIACSYLYRYWKHTSFIMKTYLMLGIFALMVITSVGIFGFLSAGYQTDALPLQQMEEQVAMLQQEKERKVERKVEIDKQISNLPANYVRARVQLMKQFKDEQAQVTLRINELDQQILELKQSMIKTQAHIGPIVYIAKAFDKTTDDATKWLILLIIFAFDPMAICLTIAVNIAVRVRAEEKQQSIVRVETPTVETAATEQPKVEQLQEIEDVFPQEVEEYEPMLHPVDTQVADEQAEVTPVVKAEPPAFQPPSRALHKSNVDWESLIERNSIQELIQYYQELKERRDSGRMTQDDMIDMTAIENVLGKHGLLMYVK